MSGTAPARIDLRSARADDVPTVLRFVRALAEFEHLAHEVRADEAGLSRYLFGDRPYAECLLAEADGVAAGMALYFHNFSTFAGKPGLYVEDIFVAPEYRRLGIGLALFRALAKIAVARDCARLEWAVLDWNEKAIAFYRRLGASAMSDWTVQRLTRAQTEALANG